MRIVHIAPIGHHAEGIGGVLMKLVPEQIKLGHEVRIVSVYNNLIYENIDISTIIKRSDFELYLDSWVPDIVIFHSHFHKEYIYFSKILRSRYIPYCVQLHGALSKINYQKNKVKKYIAGILMFNRILKKASTILYLNKSEYVNSIVPRYNKRYAIIPNGCDRPINIDINRPVNTPLKIVFIGRIAFIHKGLDILLDAISQMNDIYKNKIHFYFYGNEDDSGTELLKYNIKNLDIASYEGPAYGIDKDILLRSSDIFILTSRYEGMPMGVLEAWSYGVPCILTTGTNMIDESTICNAYWKTELDAMSIKTTILRAMEDMISNSVLHRQAALKQSYKFDWNNIASKSIDIYDEILKTDAIYHNAVQ